MIDIMDTFRKFDRATLYIILMFILIAIIAFLIN